MEKDNVIELVQPGEFKDQLTEVLHQDAQALILQAVEAEFAAFLENHSVEKLQDGRKRVVRHGHLPARKVVTGIGAIPVKVPRARDRRGPSQEKKRSDLFPNTPSLCQAKQEHRNGSSLPLPERPIVRGLFSNHARFARQGCCWVFSRYSSLSAKPMERRVKSVK